MKIEIKVLNKKFYGGRELPKYATAGSAALDLICTQDVTIGPDETTMIPTGLAIWVGSQTYITFRAGLILPRSGLGHNEGLVLGNTIGLLDQDYQGELMVSAHNRNSNACWMLNGETGKYEQRVNPVNINIRAGERFAQLMFIPVIKTHWDVVEEFSATTERGDGGFGSTDND